MSIAIVPATAIPPGIPIIVEIKVDCLISYAITLSAILFISATSIPAIAGLS
ncbi:MAG: hypothetical protein OGM09_12535 [Fusobacterium varium]|uniref:hypothetical protein n=1 Tax=Fusobacterium varium TaxID=856 RepID=UPI0024302FA6|nr:hypothetical protein [Fusobacterium varium]UYI77973.1 MAG: hypothetical protein OGM09_12535 [Fusobacterium varium]